MVGIKKPQNNEATHYASSQHSGETVAPGPKYGGALRPERYFILLYRTAQVDGLQKKKPASSVDADLQAHLDGLLFTKFGSNKTAFLGFFLFGITWVGCMVGIREPQNNEATHYASSQHCGYPRN